MTHDHEIFTRPAVSNCARVFVAPYPSKKTVVNTCDHIFVTPIVISDNLVGNLTFGGNKTVTQLLSCTGLVGSTVSAGISSTDSHSIVAA